MSTKPYGPLKLNFSPPLVTHSGPMTVFDAGCSILLTIGTRKTQIIAQSLRPNSYDLGTNSFSWNIDVNRLQMQSWPKLCYIPSTRGISNTPAGHYVNDILHRKIEQK